MAVGGKERNCEGCMRVCLVVGRVQTVIVVLYVCLFRRQEEITSEREEIDRQKKMLVKKRPSNSETGGRKRASSQSGTAGTGTASTNSSGVPINSAPAAVSTPPIALPNAAINNANQVTGATTGTVLHNGTVAPSSALDTATFLKPEAVPGLSWQEYYEADEILKVNRMFFPPPYVLAHKQGQGYYPWACVHG